ncbi:MAG: type 4a pilus biogenesis protein PilO [Acidobacteriia bacterium]|nr:type 4a pilus biogenesis protein PilO [Terriglobia bacterium]
MPPSFDWKKLRKGISRPRKDPRAPWHAVFGVLVVLNLVALYFTMQPLGGTAEELDSQLATLRMQVQRSRAEVTRLRAIVTKVDKAQAQQTDFMKSYFMDRRTASSDILTEIGSSAKKAGLKPKEHAFVIEPIEGSESISMMTITANYEGTYADLVHFVNEVDRSKRFLIIENITAAPQQVPGMLASRFKINTFVREAKP